MTLRQGIVQNLDNVPSCSAEFLTRLQVGATVARVGWINDLFDAWYWILVAVLVVMVPVWFGKFLYEATATVLHRRRAKESGEPSTPPGPRDSGRRRPR
jgi:hypothetical protein